MGLIQYTIFFSFIKYRIDYSGQLIRCWCWNLSIGGSTIWDLISSLPSRGPSSLFVLVYCSEVEVQGSLRSFGWKFWRAQSRKCHLLFIYLLIKYSWIHRSQFKVYLNLFKGIFLELKLKIISCLSEPCAITMCYC